MHRGYVHDDEEYKISNYHLFKYIQSNDVLVASTYNQYLINLILKFLQCHVFIHEDSYLYYLQKYIQHYISHSSAHEEVHL